MKLAKPHFDIGLFTNRRDAQLGFWREDVGLEVDHMAKLGGGVQQHRHIAHGSIIKVNHARGPLPDLPQCGYRQLMIARDGLKQARDLADPDGNRVRLVPPGTEGVVGIGVRLTVNDLTAGARFYGESLGLEAVGDGNFLCGDSRLFLEHDPAATPAGAMQAPGYRYLTIQVADVDTIHAEILARGGTEGAAPQNYGTTARVSFVRDPDGNWIEISQRASVTGVPITGAGAPRR